MTLVFPEIGDANIPLRHLILLLADMRLHADFSVDGVTKLKIFEMLNLRRIVGLDSIHVEDICKHWLVLIELDLVFEACSDTRSDIGDDETRNKVTLADFHRTCKNIYKILDRKGMLKILEKRCHDLKIELYDRIYRLNVTTDLVIAHKQKPIRIISLKAWILTNIMLLSYRSSPSNSSLSITR